MNWELFDATVVFPCGTKKEYKQVARIHGVKVDGKRPVEIHVTNGEPFTSDLKQILDPRKGKIFINGELRYEL